MSTTKIKIDVSDPATRELWDAAKRAKAEVSRWPAWKRGDMRSDAQAACEHLICEVCCNPGARDVGRDPDTDDTFPVHARCVDTTRSDIMSAADQALRLRLDGCNRCVEIVGVRICKTRWWEWRKRRELISLWHELQGAKDELRARKAGPS